MHNPRLAALLASLAMAALGPALLAQDETAPATPPTDPEPLFLPDLIIIGQKTPISLQDAPLSDTVVTSEVIREADVKVIQDAVKFAPNTFITEFSARKLSNPRFRGIGSSPLNPGVTTYIDGIPILNANAANSEFLNVRQIELVRGPQSTLFGRNNLGGLILVDSADPTGHWTAGNITTIGDYNLFDTRATVSGPLTDTTSVGLSYGYAARDGYSINNITGNDIDNRQANFGKLQFMHKPDDRVTLRWNILGESADDGDYALHDLGALRLNPFQVSRDYEGFTKRDLILSSFEAMYEGDNVDFTAISGFLWWNTVDSTDLDYSPLPLITRNNEEDAHQFTQEFRLASPVDAPIQVGRGAEWHWQTGIFLFQQKYDQIATNNMSPFVTGLPFLMQDTTTGELEDWGAGIYTHNTLRLWDRLDLTAGVRADYEEKDAILGAYTNPLFAPPTVLELNDEFVAVSPTFAIGLDVTEQVRLYSVTAKGYKAGGFNPIHPVGNESYDEESSWNYEAGVKTNWWGGLVRANAAFYYTNWNDLQQNVPVLTVPGRFYVDNIGEADSKGIELDLQVHPTDNLAAYVAFGVADAEYLGDSFDGGVSVTGNRLPYTPDYTVSTGVEASLPLSPSGLELFARADIAFVGQYLYDTSNAQGQEAYSLADFRLGVRKDQWFLEGWVKNAFDEDYIPIALPYGALAPSGYIGEMGAPTTFGLRFGLNF